MIFWILGYVLLAVFLEDIQDTIAHHGGGVFKGWWYAENRWRHKYKNPDGPYEWEDRKWWAKLGLVAFLDLWHAAKTTRLIATFALLVVLSGHNGLWSVPLWVLYGGLHDHVFYGRLLK